MIRRYLLNWLLVPVCVLILTSCGGSGGSGGSSSGSGGGPVGTSGDTGTVAIVLTDGPSKDFDQILANITRIELLGDHHRVTVFEGDETVDLLQLSGVSDLFAVTDAVPVGSYDKIRLTLKSLTLVRMDDSTGEMIRNEFPVHLPGNGKVDLNPRGSFHVYSGGSLVLELDVDADKAIHVVKAGKKMKFKFRPVVFVRVISGVNTDKLVRIHGQVDNIDDLTRSFDLCPNRVVSSVSADDHKGNFDDSGEQRCLRVNTAEDAGVFGVTGDPEVFDLIAAGDELTAIGKLAWETDTSQTSYHGQHKKEKGHRDLFDDHVRLNAVVLELGPSGTFVRVAGTTASEVQPDNSFDLEVAPAQGILTESPLAVQLQTGTKIYSREGEALLPADVVPGLAATVDGVLALPDAQPAYLKGALVLLNTVAVSSSLSGTLKTVDAGGWSMTVTADTGDQMVKLTDETRYFVIDADGMRSEELPSADALAAYLDGASDPVAVDIYGSEDAGELTAKLVFVYGTTSG